jgi:hypothetical protein
MVKLTLKENILPEIDGKELILVLYHNGKYYIANKERPAPAFPKIYVVPDEQIKVAVLSRLN